MTMMHYTAKAQDARLLELPEEATELGLRQGDEVVISVLTVPHHAADIELSQTRTPDERARAYRAWAESHSAGTPPLSDEAISRETIYGERG